MTIEELRKETRLPAVIVNDEGMVIYVNECFNDVFGYQEDEMIDRALTTIIPGDLRDAHNLGFSRFLATQKPTLLNKPLVLKAVRKDGREFDAEHFIIAEQDGDQWLFGATIKPIEPSAE